MILQKIHTKYKFSKISDAKIIIVSLIFFGGVFVRKLCRVLFSRYFVSATLILAEFFLLFYLLSFSYEYSAYALAFFGIVDIIVIASLVSRDANPEYKISWLIIVMLLPPFGAFLYAIFYSRKVSMKKAKFMRCVQDNLNGFGENSDSVKIEEDENLEQIKKTSASAWGKSLAILEEDRLSSVYRNTTSRFFDTGEAMYESILSDLSSAKRYIFLEFFIIEQGKMWEKIHKILKEKAKEGVDVRVIYDDIGCMKTLPARYDKKLKAEGIRCVRFSPVSPKISTAHNNRNHRKIIVIDGVIAYTGGVNIADEYINEKSRFGHWKDGGVRVSGDAAIGFLKLFLSSWDFALNTITDINKFLPDGKREGISDGGFYIPFGSGPMPIYKSPVGKNSIINVINQSERYLYITTPYLIIDYDLTEAIRNTAKRGVDVRIVTPKIPDKKLVKVMTKSAYPYLLEAGVRIYEYTPGFIHEKAVVSDDAYAIVGTINMDYRSLAHHYEDALWMYNTPTVLSIKEDFLNITEISDEKDKKEAKLSFFEVIIRNLIRVFAPLL